MTIVTKKIGFTIEIDEEVIAPQNAKIFIYQLLNRLGYEHNITSITIDDTTLPISSKEELYDLSLGEDKELEEDERVVLKNQEEVKK